MHICMYTSYADTTIPFYQLYTFMCVHVYHLEGCTVASGVHMYHMKLRMCIMHTHPDTTFVPHV